MTEQTNPQVETPTDEEIARHLSAAMDSVNLLNAGQPEGMEDADWADTVARNKEHLAIMVAKPWWGDTDISALQAAAA
jgi:hypothetical protein